MLRKGLPLVVLLTIVVSSLAFRTSARPIRTKRGFYYWKTEWSSSPEIVQRLTRSHIDRLYMRFFDVEWDEAGHSAQPVAMLRLASPLPPSVEIVPVVYITNTVFLNIEYAEVEALADHVWAKVARVATTGGLAFDELQVDCDWSDGSRRNYFHFVDLLSRKLSVQRKVISTTLRLHQVKYVQRTGVPPAARAMLMMYNFGRIEADSARSSIFNAADGGRYASYIADYPLELDVVLPAFSWSIHSREGRVLGLLEHVTADDAASFDGFRRSATHEYEASRSFFFRGRYFMAGDHLLMETTTPDVTREAAAMAKRGAGWRKSYGTVALFDLDDTRSTPYSGADIESILSTF
jgi:hypothetical protein